MDSKAQRVTEVLARPRVLTREETLLVDALRFRGWRVAVAEESDRAGRPQSRATAWRTDPDATTGVPVRRVCRARKPTATAALAAVLAKVLEREA